MEKLRGVQRYGYKLSFDLDGAKMNITISPVEAVKYVHDRNIPDLDEYRDPELYADAIPELMEQAGRMEREHAKWVRQGWWPRPQTVEKWSVMVVVVPVPFQRGEGLMRLDSDKPFDTLEQAKSAIEAVLPSLMQRRRPAWLVPEALIRENSRLRKNMKAPYWFVAEGAGYRLLEHGAPTKTKYKTIAAAKADVSERNNAFRAEHPKKTKKPRTRKNGPTLDRPYYPFAEKEAQYAAYTDAQLHYALADARKTAKAEDEMAKSGHGLSRYGWYADDVHTIAAEIRKRRAPRTRSNPTAWQKAMRKTSAPKRSKFEVTAVEQNREGTYAFDLDLGKDGWGRIHLYPDAATSLDGYLMSSTLDLTPVLRAKMEAWIKKHAKKIKAIPEFGRAYPSNW